MKDVMALITNTKSEEKLSRLTQDRCIADIPFGGNYSLIDFVLSNVVNSGIRNIGIIITHKYRSLMYHLGSGKEWSLDTKRDGLFFLPSNNHQVFHKPLHVDLRDIYNNIDYLHKSTQKYIVISGANVICNMDYHPLLEFHKRKESDVTILHKKENELTPEDYFDCDFLNMDSNHRVTRIVGSFDEATTHNVSMELCILERELLLKILDTCIASGNWDLIDILNENTETLKIYAYPYDGYAARINSVHSYYKHNMEILNPDIWEKLFLGTHLIYTRTKDNPPTKYDKTSSVHNSLVSFGCAIKGEVKNSILFREVKIGHNCNVKNCIIMQNGLIEDNVFLENVIIDKDVYIKSGTYLQGKAEDPVVIAKKSVI